MSVISAEQFKNKATRVIQIPGFEPGEQIEVRIKPVSMMAMMTNGRLPNELKGVASELFKSGMNGNEPDEDYSMEQIQLMTQLIDKLCEDCLVEPVFNDIKDYLTDEQKTAIFTASQGVIQAVKPIVQE